ncbi:MAG: MarR family transcriptional regulator [Lamprocystis purpurea]|jgi:predicted transcriptional regulator|uniref:HVO_A0114 family putative DNA-binding protein n=1 Tax=Lamprocystis purpurea TaxID=61598 RepID=UPI00036EEE88|nr:MarR family transcriptional regulator [Lamprocystis purpurea]MBV5273069.1 MarR family transcriptional regulator [Lamprocystis purpurea]
MNRIEISVLRPEAALRACAEVWHAVETGEAVTPRLAFGSLHELFSAITEKRLDLLRHVADHDGLTIWQLANALGRDYKNVHTDVTRLVDLGLLERRTDGGLSTLYDEILIHADIRAAA